MGMVQYGMRMRGMEYVPRHLRRSEMSEKKVNNSKYMNELIMVKCVYTSEETGGGGGRPGGDGGGSCKGMSPYSWCYNSISLSLYRQLMQQLMCLTIGSPECIGVICQAYTYAR